MQLPIIVLVFIIPPPSLFLSPLLPPFSPFPRVSKWPLSLSFSSKLSLTQGFSFAFFIKIAVICHTTAGAREREGWREEERIR